MNKTPFICIGLLTAVLSASRGFALEPVSVAAGADKDYVVRKFGESGSKARPETYFFARGSFFDGAKSDGSLDKMRFMDIAHELASDLAVQRYYPSKDPKNADLLIVVHWGMTQVQDDASNGQADMERLTNDLQVFNSGLQKSASMDPGFVNSDLAVMDAKSASPGASLSSNAKLIGYTNEYAKEEYNSLGYASGMSEEDHQLREDLQSERYFVILMAYDYRSLVDGRKNGTKPKLLWSTHISISAIGQNFKTALPAMSKIGAAYFGRQVDGLMLNIRNIPTGRVEIGVPKTVEEKKTN